MKTEEMENQDPETTTKLETTPEPSGKSPKSALKRLEAEIKKRVARYATDERTVIEKRDAAVANAIRLGWLIRDVKEEIKVNGNGITFREWMESNFAKEWSVEGANHVVKISRRFQIDIEYAALRERFGIVRLVESPSEHSLERQLTIEALNSSYTSVLRGVGFLPGKSAAGSDNGDKKTPPKTQEQKVLAAFDRFKTRYQKLRADIDDGSIESPGAEFWDAIKVEFAWASREHAILTGS